MKRRLSIAAGLLLILSMISLMAGEAPLRIKLVFTLAWVVLLATATFFAWAPTLSNHMKAILYPFFLAAGTIGYEFTQRTLGGKYEPFDFSVGEHLVVFFVIAGVTTLFLGVTWLTDRLVVRHTGTGAKSHNPDNAHP